MILFEGHLQAITGPRYQNGAEDADESMGE